jgi:hypothetical protein
MALFGLNARLHLYSCIQFDFLRGKNSPLFSFYFTIDSLLILPSPLHWLQSVSENRSINVPNPSQRSHGLVFRNWSTLSALILALRSWLRSRSSSQLSINAYMVESPWKFGFLERGGFCGLAPFACLYIIYTVVYTVVNT